MNFKTKIGTALVLVLIALIFFSKTIYTYNLPVVTAGELSEGSLYMVEEIMGIVDYTSTWDMYATLSGKAAEVLKKEGDTVVQGEPVIYMSYDMAVIQQALSQLEISRARLALEIESINMQMYQTNSSIGQLMTEVYTPQQTSDSDLIQLDKDIVKAEEDYSKMEMLYDVGGIPQKQLDDLLIYIETLKSNYASLEEIIKEDAEKEEIQLREKEKARERQMEAYNYTLQTYEQQLKAKELDLKSLDIQEGGYRNSLKTYSQSVEIVAPSDGIITNLWVKAGQSVNAGQLLFEATEGYKIECQLPKDNEFVVIGDIAGVSTSKTGTVTNIELVENKKNVTLMLDTDKVTAGESMRVRFQKRIGGSYTLIQNGALKKDNIGHFIYQIKRRNGILGMEYFVELLYVQTEGSDGKYTAIIDDIGSSPVVLLSDKPVYNNDIIKVKNESDFFD